MEATRHHVLWESGQLDSSLEKLLEQYRRSLGVVTQGVPAELVQGASQIPSGQASVLASGPADCVAPENELEQHLILRLQHGTVCYSIR